MFFVTDRNVTTRVAPLGLALLRGGATKNRESKLSNEHDADDELSLVFVDDAGQVSALELAVVFTASPTHSESRYHLITVARVRRPAGRTRRAVDTCAPHHLSRSHVFPTDYRARQ